jgi:hypothetical protein
LCRGSFIGIFSKQNIGKNDGLKQQIKNLLENVEITNELVSSICNEVIILISEKKTSLNNIHILSNNKNQIIFSLILNLMKSKKRS